MANPFTKKNWLKRIVQYPGRRKLNTTETDNVYDVERNEGNVSQKGDGFTVENMNDLENRVDTAFAELDARMIKSVRYAIPTNSIAPQGGISIATTLPNGNKIVGAPVIYCNGGSHTLIFAGFAGGTNINIRNVGTVAYVPPSNSWLNVFYLD